MRTTTLNMDDLNEEKLAVVLEVRLITESVFVIRFERNDLNFIAGQYVVIGTRDIPERREYSIYSPVNVDYLEILVQMVDRGSFSFHLRELEPGDQIYVRGPFGSFKLEDTYLEDKNIFIASGTGISPFHSMVLSYPELYYTIIHGVRNLGDGYERSIYVSGQYIQCTSTSKGSEFYGRVTDYLRTFKPDSEAHYYLCGNSAMIDEAWNLLKAANVPFTNIHAEVYF